MGSGGRPSFLGGGDHHARDRDSTNAATQKCEDHPEREELESGGSNPSYGLLLAHFRCFRSIHIKPPQDVRRYLFVVTVKSWVSKNFQPASIKVAECFMTSPFHRAISSVSSRPSSDP
jgi:hypothetical protein